MPTGLPPVVDSRTRVLVLGSMPGEVSLAKHQYYGHPRNAFWRIMSDLIGFDASASYPCRLEALLSAGIGLWDVLRYCERTGSLDSWIARETMEVNDFDRLSREYPAISRLFFNGAKASQVFARLVAPTRAAPLECTRLPSTSPAHAAMPYSAKLAEWRAVVDVG
ncbi:MAG: DNA-deoxyinosine glycosylase [Candidatus Sericytochromatia bacterium]